MDSTTDFDAPDLSAEVASMLVKSHNDYILKQSAYKMGLGKAFEEAAKRYKTFYFFYCNRLATKTLLPTAHIGTERPTDLLRKTDGPQKPEIRPAKDKQVHASPGNSYTFEIKKQVLFFIVLKFICFYWNRSRRTHALHCNKAANIKCKRSLI